MIYYILTEDEWESAKEEDEYWPDDFDERGYIPCADPGQENHLVGELNLTDNLLIILTIDTAKLESVIIYEDVNECGRMSPHIYGYINLDAVMDAEDFEPATLSVPS